MLINIVNKILNISARLIICIAINFYTTKLQASDNNIGVIYPKLPAPYAAVFDEIIKGIEDNVSNLNRYQFEENSSSANINAWAKENNINAVISLGKSGFSNASFLPGNIPIIYGGVLFPPEMSKANTKGIVLTPSPNILFEQLNSFSNEIKTITVVYNKKNSNWLIEEAKKAADLLGIKLIPLASDNIVEASNHYADILKDNLDKSHAIWLLKDRKTINYKSILPELLKEAWREKFIVFSSNPHLVKQGILFSLYPDNVAMGVSLGELAINLNKHSSNNKSFYTLDKLKIAVNTRAAEHLGISLEKKTIDKFDLRFP